MDLSSNSLMLLDDIPCDWDATINSGKSQKK